MSDLAAALTQWRALLGDDAVRTDPVTRAAYETATFATTHRVPAVLRPTDRASVSACLRVATEHATPVYPVSRGCNWGLGSRVPTADGCVVLDLSALDRITAFDDALGTITVEPGVTFAQVHAFLAERRAKWFVSVTGSSPHASVLANALERGDGAGPYGDRALYACDLEVALATGEVIRTGFGRFDAALATAHRWGVGPSLDGMFLQSNLGVVTRMTVWLAPMAGSIQSARFSLRDPSRLPALVDALRVLRLEGTLRGAVALWSDVRALSTPEPFPWGATITRAQLDTYRAEHPAPRWTGLTALYAATELQGRAHRERMVEVLAPCVDAWSVEERVGDACAGEELLSPRDPALGWLQGVPSEESLRSAWAAKGPSPARDMDPDRDRCGAVWAVVALPWRGADALRAVTVAESVLLDHGIAPALALNAPGDRALHLLAMVLYDRDRDGDDARAMRAHDALLDALRADGYLPARLGVHSMTSLPSPRDDSDAVLRRLRAALDPAAILAPGRYSAR